MSQSQQQKINADQGRIKNELKELQRQHIKLECYKCIGNLNLFGLQKEERESNIDTKAILCARS